MYIDNRPIKEWVKNAILSKLSLQMNSKHGKSIWLPILINSSLFTLNWMILFNGENQVQVNQFFSTLMC